MVMNGASVLEEGAQVSTGGTRAKATAGASRADKQELSHNLLGQRLGRKGRGTRERILAATERLLAGSRDTAISLSAVAREASLGMTSLYPYFADLTELLLAVLEPIMASAEPSYIAHLRERWPDDHLGEHCLRFASAYHAFWERNARILHLRNSFADNGDVRMREYRIAVSQPLIQLLVGQMDSHPGISPSSTKGTATVLLTAIERVATVATAPHFADFTTGDSAPNVRNLVVAEARLLELGIREYRAGTSWAKAG